MSNLLLYSDLKKAVKDISIQPDAETIADFIQYWSHCHKDFADAFLMILQKAIEEADKGHVITKTELEMAEGMNIQDYSYAPNKRLRFASAYVESVLADEGWGKELSSAPIEKQTYVIPEPNSISFNVRHIHMKQLVDCVTYFSNLLEFISTNQINDFAKVLFASDLRSNEFKSIKIRFTCQTQQAAYIFYKISKKFHFIIKGKFFDDTEIFITSRGNKLTNKNYSKSKCEAIEIEFENKAIIDSYFNKFSV